METDDFVTELKIRTKGFYKSSSEDIANTFFPLSFDQTSIFKWNTQSLKVISTIFYIWLTKSLKKFEKRFQDDFI